MADNRAEFVISLNGDDSAIRGVFNAFKKTVSDGAADLERTTSNITLFKGLKQNLDAAAATVNTTTAALNKLQIEVVATKLAGEDIGKDLAKNLKDAERAANSANKEFAKQQTAVDKMAKSLTAAGVDIKSLATEEIRLTTAAKQAAQAEAERQAAATLGIKLSRDVAAGIQQQVAALNTLKNSGSASVLDIANAQRALAANTKAATAELNTGKAAVNDFGASLRSGLAGALLPFAGITAAIAAIVSGFKDAIAASKEFRQGIAEIGTVTNLSKDQLAGLGEGARDIARSLGVDLNQALKGLFDLIRSGVSPDNALEVLRVSAEAAKASLTDVGTGVKAANLLLDAFGANVSDLPLLFDKITVGAHNGGATLKEFADSAGPLLSVARATGQSFDELLAVLTVLVDKSGNAEKSFSDLTKILAKLNTADVKEKLEGIGITATSVAEIFKQIGDRGLTLSDVLGLDLASSGVKSAAGLSALTSSAGEVPEKLDKIAVAAGEVNKSLAVLYDSPKERSARLDAALHETALSFGELFGAGSKFQVFATDVVQTFNFMQFGILPVSTATKALRSDIGDLVTQFSGLPIPAEAAAASIRATGEAAADAAKKMELAKVQAGEIKAKLSSLSSALLADVQALQASVAKDIADATARADAQIAQLNRSKEAEAATAKETIAIRLQLAKDTFDLIAKNEKAISDAVTAANAARERTLRASGVTQQKIDQETAQARLAAISQTLAAYQKLYSDLVALAQTAAARVQSFELARVSIAQQVEDQIRAIRFEGLSGLDQFVARNAEIDRLISEGRRTAAEGDIETSKKFFEQAIAQAQGLTKVVNDNGVAVVTATQAQTAKLEALKKVQDASNQAYTEQAAAAKTGADGAIEEAGRVAGKIVELEAQYDSLKATVAEGLKLRLVKDEESFDKAFAALDELTKPREVVVTVKTVNEEGAPVAAPEPAAGFAKGGPVERFARGGPVGGRSLPLRGYFAARASRALAGQPVQAFARGGAVFRRPAWMKVPGQGSGDTVPAALQAGSFVVRKSASRHYGDGLMSRLARGFAVGGDVQARAGEPLRRKFAAGGTVTKDEIRKYAEDTFGFDPFASGPGQRQPQGGTGKPKERQPGDPLGENESVQSTDPPLSFDSRPIPQELITAANVIQYAQEMLNMVGQTNPLLGVLLPDILGGIRKVQANPNDTAALADLLKAAETIGSNPYVFAMWGKTTSSAGNFKPEWFIDWLAQHGQVDAGGNLTSQGGVSVDLSSFANKFFDAGIAKTGAPSRAERILGGGAIAKRFFGSFARGGPAGSDTVPALLTPGEWVIRKPAVGRYGAGLLHAINNMSISRTLLANMMMPPQMPSRFAEGGQVGASNIGGSVSSPAREGGPSSGITVNITADANVFGSADNLRKLIIPIVRDVVRRGQ